MLHMVSMMQRQRTHHTCRLGTAHTLTGHVHPAQSCTPLLGMARGTTSPLGTHNLQGR